ncbi:RabGAP/TBC [Amylocystis lapponica]|nr:RabGAP/TBC [Amylocystis lapponica]
MDFELVQPTIPHSPLPTSSVDSLPLSPIREGTSFPIADRSAPLDTSGAKRSVEQSQAEPQTTKPLEPQDAEMHRQRESKWLNMTTAIPPSQARKSKKVRKLLLEGVPASMRYKVWAHLTDSTAKRMEGIYTRLGQRERVAAIADIERDVPGLFTDRPELQDASLVNLLQAYLTMVPDIQYNRGLAVIAAQLLMLTPEEDAFWTFTSMMDSHLRPYFSSNAIQLEVDASLFGKVVEANDAALAKKIFVDAAIPPVSICRPWFTTLFVDALPSDYFHRVWDIFLFEGITFLFRVGLALLTCCRRALLQSTGQDSVLAILSHPPAASLPPTPEALLELAFSVKVKDDDIRKQRSKLEAQVKRQTQARALSSKPSGTSARGPSISLPRN